jgi:hypothetical protein
MAVHQVVELYGPDGNVVRRAEIGTPPAPVARAYVDRTLRGAATKAELANQRRALLDYGAHSKRGMASVEMTLTVVDALLATTDRDYHAALRRLPVTITRVAQKDSYGRDGVLASYAVRGHVRLAHFSVNGGSSGASAGSGTADDDSAEGASPRETGSTIADDGRRDDCWYAETQSYEPCATEEELDEALSAVLAAEEDHDGIVSDYGAEYDSFMEWCSENPVECEPANRHETALLTPAESLTALNLSSQVIEQGETDSLSLVAGHSGGDASDVPHPCFAETFGTVTGILGTVGTILTAKSQLSLWWVAVRLLTPLAAGAAAWGSVLVVVAAVAGTAYFAYQAVSCFRSQKK